MKHLLIIIMASGLKMIGFHLVHFVVLSLADKPLFLLVASQVSKIFFYSYCLINSFSYNKNNYKSFSKLPIRYSNHWALNVFENSVIIFFYWTLYTCRHIMGHCVPLYLVNLGILNFLGITMSHTRHILTDFIRIIMVYAFHRLKSFFYYKQLFKVKLFCLLLL
jgi:hypothetical protein